MTASKAANIIRIMCDKQNRDPRFIKWVTDRIKR